MKMPVVALLSLLVAASSAVAAPISPKDFEQRPALVLVLVVDQFRADYLTRFRQRFAPAHGAADAVGGFEYLIENGAYFPLAHYDILQNMTGPGHATILSGSLPYQAGIPTNYWFDVAHGTSVYCVEDPSSPVIGGDPKLPSNGLSPRNLKASTIGDELKNAGYDSKVIGIALKDRAAILLGGHRADLSAWVDQATMRWVTSKYFVADNKLPAWMVDLNADLEKHRGDPITWSATGRPSGLSLKESVGHLTAVTGPDFGLDFPHHSKVGDASTMAMPFGLAMTEVAAERAVDAYSLGNHAGPDLLAVSFSSHDYVGHAFGPNSREMEEMTIAEDLEIAKLLNHVRKKVPSGLKRTLVVLTADHGIPPNPTWLSGERVDAGRIEEKKLVADLEEHLKSKFGAAKGGGDKWVAKMFDLGIYLNREASAAKGVSFDDVEASTKAFVIAHEDGAAFVVTSSDYRARRLPPGKLEREILATYVPGRSADIILVPKPYYFSAGNTVDHMSSYSYDRTVPLILAGSNLKPGVYPSDVAMIDLAPTLSFLLGIVPPTMAEGRVLAEAIGH